MKINTVNVNSTRVNPVQNKEVQRSPEMDKVNVPESQPNIEKKYETGEVGNEQRQDVEMMDKSIEQANKSLSNFNRRIERTVHDVTHTIMYTIKDTRTDEIIGEFPPKKIQDMIAKMWELAGLFVDEKA